jgi:hypothetical protein
MAADRTEIRPCDVCGEAGKPLIQVLYGQRSRVALCPAHRASRRALGYELRAS